MKRLALGISVAAIVAAAATLSLSGQSAPTETGEPLQVDVGTRNPWTNLAPNNRADSFQFAIVTDRTGGHRPGVFTRAIEKINMLQPEFVVSVGDLIEGGTEDPGQWALEWSEFESKVDMLQMPFFFCPGNHDISNVPMSDEWKRKFGRTYYHFRYKDVLFLVLNTEDGPKKWDEAHPYNFSPEQQAYAAEALAQNQDVRWTFVFFHKPTWSYPDKVDQDACGWTAIEQLLQGRRYTVFAGHRHVYARYIRHGQEYYMLATTGGSTKLRGLDKGEFDHFVWVTMKPEGPVVANLLLDGVLNRDVRTLRDGEQPE